ncbi:putative late blight resistance protein homolog R1A-10 isoform X2 [Salvia miltiorrhiza]|uniref:putative late blight resistance protein homolog R1A-10 isoform X2 n=1 Tax=Salvia miltiorrhiza TaxID=226208 RepID=UPI0025AC1C81|nr:putative late blight resistance protein homolog R1A-10 isoform X2 [Salvia miltiorrhiza]XP_057772143.1 putative late blight resistance protein homolog R1A-10 isoform X2 [Salvia miltiorrhiza]
MADAAIEFLLENIKEIMQYHANSIIGAKREIENLESDLRFFREFLRDRVKKRRKDEFMKVVVREIQDLVYESEDIIDVFITNGVHQKSTKSSSSIDLHAIDKRVKGIKQKIELRWPHSDILSFDCADNREKPEPRPPRMKNVVGFKDVTEDLIRRLTQETNYFDVISVIGMFGLGKTTLACKVYNDLEIQCFFPIRIWLSISQDFSARDIFLDILKQLTTISDHILAKNDHELAYMVADLLKRGRFLIVMDDVWETADWDRLHAALPEDNTKGKVLITSRMNGVSYYASRPRPPYNLRLFNLEESWELLRLEALGKLDCPSQLELVGRRIAKSCDGLPLAIAVIGGMLATRSSGSVTTATRRYWEKVSDHVSSYAIGNDPADRMQKSISLSYDKLPYHLRPCFLYFGLFPKDYEIPVSKLIRMWIGEGFVQENRDCSLEETAEKYLEDLININLVRNEKFMPYGKVKTCRVHDMVRDFCCIEAANENFLQEIKCNNDGQFTPSTSYTVKYRRLSLHSKCLDFISLRLFGPRVSSFVCLSKDTYFMSPENSSNIIGSFKQLRVLDVLPFKFTKIDVDLYNLLHLRYIALSSNLSVLPSKFNQLWNIQTLIVDTTCRTLKVEADIWTMNQLRHFKTNATATLLKSTKSGEIGERRLQTLGLISVESCTEELSHQAPNLKKLGIRGQLALLFNRRSGVFDLRNMSELGKLKLINDVYPNPGREGGLSGLPQPHQFPPSLTSLTLCATFLSWEHMSTLGLLKRLEVLKLKDYAFSGDIWEAADGGFRCLELLYIEDTDLIDWNASSHHYPKLNTLVLKNCEKLRGIPAELADIPSLQKLELHTCISAAESAKDILDAKKQTLAEGSAFTLSIFPPI